MRTVFEEVPNNYEIVVRDASGAEKTFSREKPISYDEMSKIVQENLDYTDKLNKELDSAKFPQTLSNAHFLGLFYDVPKEEFLDGMSLTMSQKIINWLQESFVEAEGIKVKKE